MTNTALEYETKTFGLESRWLETRLGERMHYHDVGEGDAVVFVHGSGVGVSAAANWWQNISVLKNTRSVAHDLIGFGHTIPASDEEWGMDGWLAQTMRLVDALQLDRFFLVGNSLGGRISLHLALQHPDRVRGVVTMGAVGINPPRPQGTPTAQLAGATAGGSRVFTRPEIKTALRRMVAVPEVLTHELVEARYLMATAPGAPERLVKVLEARNRTTDAATLARDALAEMKMPVLLTHGREDSVIPWASSVELASIIPNADLHIFSQCGHWAQTERLDDFNSLLLRFLEKHR